MEHLDFESLRREHFGPAAQAEHVSAELALLVLDALHRIIDTINHFHTEVSTMSAQTTKLLQDVSDLKIAFTTLETGVAAQIASLKASPAADDPDVATAIAELEALTVQVKADTPVLASGPVSTDPAPVSEPAPVTKPTPVIDSTPVSDPAPVEEPAPVTEPTPVTDPTPVSDPAPVEDPAPVTK